MEKSEIDDGKALAIVAYLYIFGALIAIVMNLEKKNAFTSFHGRQGLGLTLTSMAVGWVISQLDSVMVSISFWVFFAVLYLYGIFGAVSGKTNEVPILGPLYQKWFKNLGR